MWTAREYRVRYKQSLLGVAWGVVSPIAILLLFGALANDVLGISVAGLPYLSFAFCGIVPWSFASGAISQGLPSTFSAGSIISRVYFPREVIPLAVVGATSIDLAVGTGLLFVLAAFQGHLPSVTLLALPAVYAPLFLWVGGVTIFGAAITPFVRDLRHAVPLLLQIIFFASPIVYPVERLPESWQWTASANPIAVVAEGTRDVVLRNAWPDWRLLLLHAIVGFVLCHAAISYTRSVETRMADIL